LREKSCKTGLISDTHQSIRTEENKVKIQEKREVLVSSPGARVIVSCIILTVSLAAIVFPAATAASIPVTAAALTITVPVTITTSVSTSVSISIAHTIIAAISVTVVTVVTAVAITIAVSSGSDGL
jgi:hypothetical protein